MSDVEYLKANGVPGLVNDAIAKLLETRPVDGKSGFCTIATSMGSSQGKPKLTYFQLAGRGEAIRLCFVIGGVDFDDIRISFEEFGKRKAAGDFLFGALPLLEVDGKQYAQSMAILKYAAARSGLYPAKLEDQMAVDQVLFLLESDVMAKVPRGTEEERPALRKAWVRDVVPKLWGPLEKAAMNNPSGFIVGDTMTAADIAIAALLTSVREGTFDHVTLDDLDYPALKKLLNAVDVHPAVVQWRATLG